MINRYERKCRIKTPQWFLSMMKYMVVGITTLTGSIEGLADTGMGAYATEAAGMAQNSQMQPAGGAPEMGPAGMTQPGTVTQAIGTPGIGSGGVGTPPLGWPGTGSTTYGTPGTGTTYMTQPGACAISIVKEAQDLCYSDIETLLAKVDTAIIALEGVRDQRKLELANVKAQLVAMDANVTANEILQMSTATLALNLYDVLPAAKLVKGTKVACEGVEIATRLTMMKSVPMKTGVLYIAGASSGIATDIGHTAIKLTAKNVTSGKTWSWVNWVPVVGNSVGLYTWIDNKVYSKADTLNGLGEELTRLANVIWHMDKMIQEKRNDKTMLQMQCGAILKFTNQ